MKCIICNKTPNIKENKLFVWVVFGICNTCFIMGSKRSLKSKRRLKIKRRLKTKRNLKKHKTMRFILTAIGFDK